MNNTQKQKIGLQLALGSAFAFSLLNIGLRYVQDETELSAWGILLFRGLVAIVVASGISLAAQKSILGKNRALLAMIGLCSFLSNLCTVTAIGMIPLYQALVLLYLSPAISVPLGFLINGHRVSRREIILVVIAFGGCLLLLWPDGSIGLEFGLGHLIAAVNPFLYSTSFVLTNRLDDGCSGPEPLIYFGCWSAAGSAAVILLGADSGLNLGRTIAPALGLGILAVSAILMGYMALRRLPAFKVGIIGTLEILIGAMASWFMFSDPFSLRALAGGALIVYAAFKLRTS